MNKASLRKITGVVVLIGVAFAGSAVLFAQKKTVIRVDKLGVQVTSPIPVKLFYGDMGERVIADLAKDGCHARMSIFTGPNLDAAYAWNLEHVKQNEGEIFKQEKTAGGSLVAYKMKLGPGPEPVYSFSRAKVIQGKVIMCTQGSPSPSRSDFECALAICNSIAALGKG